MDTGVDPDVCPSVRLVRDVVFSVECTVGCVGVDCGDATSLSLIVYRVVRTMDAEWVSTVYFGACGVWANSLSCCAVTEVLGSLVDDSTLSSDCTGHFVYESDLVVSIVIMVDW